MTPMRMPVVPTTFGPFPAAIIPYHGGGAPDAGMVGKKTVETGLRSC